MKVIKEIVKFDFFSNNLITGTTSGCNISESEVTFWHGLKQSKSNARHPSFRAETSTDSVTSSSTQSSLRSSNSQDQTQKQGSISTFMDQLSIQDKELIDHKLAHLFYRCAIPFHIMDSRAFKDFLCTIRPAYGNSISLPSAKVLGGSLLSLNYNRMFETGIKMLNSTGYYSLATDGWSNQRNEHMVNFIIIVPGI